MNDAIELRRPSAAAADHGPGNAEPSERAAKWLVFGDLARPYHGGYHGFGPSASNRMGEGPILPPPEAPLEGKKAGPSAGMGPAKGAEEARRRFHGDAPRRERR